MSGKHTKSEADPFVQAYLDEYQRRNGTSEGTPSLEVHLARVPSHLRDEVGDSIRKALKTRHTWGDPGLCY